MPGWLTRSFSNRDLVGIAIGLGFMAWVILVVSRVGGRPGPVLALVSSALVAMIVAGAIGTHRPMAIPILVAFSPIALSLPNPGLLLGHGPLGYVNASGALYVVAAAAALLAGGSMQHRVTRSLAYGTAAVWIAIPWISGARTAAIAGVLLPVVLLVPHTRAARRVVLLMASAIITTTFVLTLVLGNSYEPGGRGGTADRVVDATLGELRVVLWRDAVELVQDHPLWGVGPGMFQQASPTANARVDAAWVHNEFLEVAVETGTVGGLLIVALVTWAFWRLSQPAPSGPSILGAVALGSLTINATIDYVWHFPTVVLALSLLIGAASVDRAPPAPTFARLSSDSSPAILVTLGLWAVLLLPIEILNPAYTIPNGVARLHTPSGVEFTGTGGLIRSQRPPERLYEQIRRSQALTIEMWAATHDIDQHGPARLVSASDGTINRNVTVGQDGDRLIFRLRTSATDWNATDPHLSVEGVFDSTDLQHIVVTTNVEVTRVFVDGVIRAEWNGPGGTLDNWIHTYPLLLGNERAGDRPWAGEFRLVAIYDTALTIADVNARYADGPSPSVETASVVAAPIAKYTFDDPGERTVADRSQMALGGDLEVPANYEAPAPSFTTMMADLDHRPTLRHAAHALVLAAWSIPFALLMSRRRCSTLVTTVLVSLSGLAVMLAASLARHAMGRAPSLTDVGAGLIGCAVGCAVLQQQRRRRSIPVPHEDE